MSQEKVEKLLNELAERTAEPVQRDLAENIKRRIPRRLVPHKGGLDTINIMIDLRISKLAAAAVIIITMILCANFLGGGSPGEGIYQDGKLLMKYWLGAGAGKGEVSAYRSIYEYLVQSGKKEVVYYGDSVDAEDSNAVLMQWEISAGRYGVILGDLRVKTVSAEELIRLQGRMLQDKSK